MVIGALTQKRASLALGNVIGSAISNILGAFSLGLLFYPRSGGSGGGIEFDRSARVYSLLLLVLTTLVVPVVYYPSPTTWLVLGPLLMAAFGVYVCVAAAAIVRGVLAAPEDSDSDADTSSDEGDADDDQERVVDSTTGLLSGQHNTTAAAAAPTRRRHGHHGLPYHTAYLFFGFAAICLAGYVLSQAAIRIVDAAALSDVVFSVVVLAVATTLPEKFIAIVSARLGQPGILVANCAGSNIFLLSLCAGLVMTGSKGKLDRGKVGLVELAVLWAATAAFTATVWFGARVARWIGAVMVVGYLAFIVLEFAVVHRT